MDHITDSVVLVRQLLKVITLLYQSGQLTVVNRQISKNLRVAVERTRESINEGPHESCGSRLDHHPGIGMNCLAVLVLVGCGDKYGDALVKILCEISSMSPSDPRPAVVGG